MFKNSPEGFITKAIRLMNEQKADMIVEHITYNRIGGTYNKEIFTVGKNSDFSWVDHIKKNVFIVNGDLTWAMIFLFPMTTNVIIL